MLYLLYLPALTLILLLYFKIAVQYNIIDKPNHRSSHTQITIRGGGIIFPIVLLLHAAISSFDYPLFTFGLLIISLISFYDDLRPLSNKLRVLVHLVAVYLLFRQAGIIGYPYWIVGISYILVIGTINAYNFMDGINGITGAYSFVTILSLYIINQGHKQFILPEWLVLSIIALLVFIFFNFRQKAKCFAGDVGSVSIAFIIIFFLIQLIVKTQDIKYIGLLLIYGLDTVTTIIFRLIKRENIFKAHRQHFYQYLANVKNWPHLQVAVLYIVAQLFVNVFVIYTDLNWVGFLLFLIFSGIVFVLTRFMVEGKTHLIRKEHRA